MPEHSSLDEELLKGYKSNCATSDILDISSLEIRTSQLTFLPHISIEKESKHSQELQFLYQAQSRTLIAYHILGNSELATN